MEPLLQKHYKNGITHGSSANRSRSMSFTFIGGGHIEFCCKEASRERSQLACDVFENLVSIPITMQKFQNWSQSVRCSQIAYPLVIGLLL